MLILRQLNNKLKQLLDCRTNVMRANNESHSFWNLLLLWFRVHACNTWVNLTLGGLKNDLAGHYSQVMIQFYQTSRITVTLRVPGQITMYGAKIYQYIIIYHTSISYPYTKYINFCNRWHPTFHLPVLYCIDCRRLHAFMHLRPPDAAKSKK
jgi:hypothetical protein